MRVSSRFRIDWERNKSRFALRIVCGLFVLYICRRWPEYTFCQFISSVSIGWIPFNIQEGKTVPAWTPYRYVYNAEKPWWFIENR